MQLVDKLNELNTTAQKLETALQAAQSLQDERIKERVSMRLLGFLAPKTAIWQSSIQNLSLRADARKLFSF